MINIYTYTYNINNVCIHTSVHHWHNPNISEYTICSPINNPNGATSPPDDFKRSQGLSGEQRLWNTRNNPEEQPVVYAVQHPSLTIKLHPWVTPSDYIHHEWYPATPLKLCCYTLLPQTQILQYASSTRRCKLANPYVGRCARLQEPRMIYLIAQNDLWFLYIQNASESLTVTHTWTLNHLYQVALTRCHDTEWHRILFCKLVYIRSIFFDMNIHLKEKMISWKLLAALRW